VNEIRELKFGVAVHIPKLNRSYYASETIMSITCGYKGSVRKNNDEKKEQR
jgi:hypothetical protein